MADNIITINKNSYATIFFAINVITTPTSSAVPYDITTTTATFAFSSSLNSPPLIKKSSRYASQCLFTSPAQGELEIYITPTDTNKLKSGSYFYSLYIDTNLGKTYVVDTNEIKLSDVVKDS